MSTYTPHVLTSKLGGGAALLLLEALDQPALKAMQGQKRLKALLGDHVTDSGEPVLNAGKFGLHGRDSTPIRRFV